MSRMAADPRSLEYDVALTLLNLHSGGSVSQRGSAHGPSEWAKTKTVESEDTEETTRLILNCVISSEVEVETSPSTIITPSFRHSVSPKISNVWQNKDSSGASTSRMKQNASLYGFNPPKLTSSLQKQTESSEIKTTREIGTQTDDYFMNDSHNNNVFANMNFKIFYERMKMLEALRSSCVCKFEKSDTTDLPSPSTDNGDADDNAYDNTEEDPDYEATMDYEEETPPDSNLQNHQPSHSKKSSTRESKTTFSVRRVLTNVNTKTNDLVPIGEGNAKVPSRVLRHINWTSYTSATRKLLTAVFSRNILASHSLTGKPSPAFPNKPAKKRLNPVLVNDIVQTVVERCCVPENVVRTSITTKCADESKMWRTRQKSNTTKKRIKLNKKLKEERKKNRENIPPLISESDSDY